MLTIYSQLVASETDPMGYTTYVFKCLESNVPFGHKFCMMVRPPNWDHRAIDIGEIGYVTYNEVVGRCIVVHHWQQFLNTCQCKLILFFCNLCHIRTSLYYIVETSILLYSL